MKHNKKREQFFGQRYFTLVYPHFYIFIRKKVAIFWSSGKSSERKRECVYEAAAAVNKLIVTFYCNKKLNSVPIAVALLLQDKINTFILTQIYSKYECISYVNQYIYASKNLICYKNT